MSKIGRKLIDLHDVQAQVQGQNVVLKGKKESLTYCVPDALVVTVKDKRVCLVPRDTKQVSRETRMLWGMSRALLANKIAGLSTPFEKKLIINGLGFKAALVGGKLDFSLGYSHKISLEVPNGVTVEIDKTGQLLTVRASDKEVVGAMCDRIRSLRVPEPYKGTGIRLADEVIVRKAGKAKAAAG